jgi:SAM-dependent methyltransferase
LSASTAATQGPEWGARAEAWAEHWERLAEPARRAVAAELGLGAGMRVLDIGCGSGEFVSLAAGLGADASGIDAADGMIAVARRRAPSADLRAGPMESLPWPDGTFDAVTAFNALQFAADFRSALAEAGRVTRPGGRIAICNWSGGDLPVVFGRLRDPEPPSPDPAPPAVREPGVLESECRTAGFEPVAAAEVDVPYEAPDLATLEGAFVEGAGMRGDSLDETAAPFRRPDGSYRFENRFRYVIARV